MSVEKPYRTNQRPLDKFLEKRGAIAPNGIYLNQSKLHQSYFKKLSAIARKAHKDEDLETLARFEAVGCTVEKGILLCTNRNPLYTFEELKRLEDFDYNCNIATRYAYIIHATMFVPDERYTVAGITYENKTAFLLTRTALGKALV